MRPETLHSLQLYRDHHVHPGGFLEACLANDFMAALGRCSADDRGSLSDIAQLIHWDMPGKCHGSYEAVRAWVRKGESNPYAVASTDFEQGSPERVELEK